MNDEYEASFNAHRQTHPEAYYSSADNIETGAFEGREDIKNIRAASLRVVDDDDEDCDCDSDE